MTDCEKIRPLVEPYLDGELDAGRAGKIAEHLNECAECAAFVENRKAFLGLLKKTCMRETVPAATRERLEAFLTNLPALETAGAVMGMRGEQTTAVRSETPAASGRFRWLRTALSTAALAAVLLGGYQIFFCNGECPYIVSAAELHDEALNGNLEAAVRGEDRAALRRLMKKVLTVAAPLPNLCGCHMKMDRAGRVVFRRLKPYKAPPGVYIEYVCGGREAVADAVTLLIQHWPENHPRDNLLRTAPDGCRYWVRREKGTPVVAWKTKDGLIYTLVAKIAKQKLVDLACNVRCMLEKHQAASPLKNH